MNWHKHTQRKLDIIIMIKRKGDRKQKKEWKGTGVVYIYIYIYIAEKLQETEQQKGHKQGQDEAQELTERE